MTNKSIIDRSHLLPAQFIWTTLELSLLIIVSVAQQMAGRTSDPESIGASPELASAFPFVAAALFGCSFAVSKVGNVAKQQQPQLSPSQSAVARYLPRMLIHCALHEAVTLLGLALALMSNAPGEIYPYVAAALIANLFVFPSAKRVAA